jgi:hypothetical protein
MNKKSVYTHAEQRGTSVKMIELHYGHINPALKAEEIAGKRHAPRELTVTANTDKKSRTKART